MKILTNHRWRNFLYRNEVPDDILADEFDWLEDDRDDGFFKYRGNWYHLDDFMRCSDSPDSDISAWHGYHGDSYFSGVLIRLSSDGEQYQVATYLS